MKQNYLKLITFSTTLLLGSTNFALGQTQENKGTLDEIAAQATIIGAKISEAKRKIEDQNPGTDFVAKDYYAQLPAFKKHVQDALDEFAIKMGNQNQGILSEMIPEMNAYNRIVDSTQLAEFSVSREIMLSQAKEALWAKAKIVTAEYESAIGVAMVKALGEFPVFVRADNYGYDRTEMLFSAEKLIYQSKKYDYIDSIFNTGDCVHFNSDSFCTLSLFAQDPIDSKYLQRAKKYGGKTNQMIYEEYFYPLISEGCSSKVCLALKADDIYNTFILLNNALSVPILFKLRDYNSVIVKESSILNRVKDNNWLRGAFVNTLYPIDPKIVGPDSTK